MEKKSNDLPSNTNPKTIPIKISGNINKITVGLRYVLNRNNSVTNIRKKVNAKTLNRSLVWLQEKDLIGLKRLNGGIRVCVCGYDSIMGIRRKEAGKDAPEQSAFLALEEAERRMGGRSMQCDCGTADGEGGWQ